MSDGKEMRPPEVAPNAPAASSRGATAKQVVRIVIGVLLMALGLAALFTPFTPGSWLALVGLEFLGLRVLLRDRLCAWAKARPQSRFRRIVCRGFRLDGRGVGRWRWRR